MITIQGKGVSKGIAKGPLYFFQRSDTTVTLKVVSDIEAEKARLAVAQEQSIQQLNALAEQCQEDAGEEMAVLFETHAMFVEDEDFVECITSLIDEKSCNAEYAVEQAGMTSKELKRLSRRELLEMLIEQMKENQRLRNRLEQAEAELENRELVSLRAGSMAEAAMQLNGVFEAADKAARQYLENVYRSAQKGDREK
jgi:phosphotransferase system enzyme I (PtsI)